MKKRPARQENSTTASSPSSLSANATEFTTASSPSSLSANATEFTTASSPSSLSANATEFTTASSPSSLSANATEFTTASSPSSLSANATEFTTAGSLAPLRARAPEFMPTSEFTLTPAVALTPISTSLNPTAKPFVSQLLQPSLSSNRTIVSNHTQQKSRLDPTTSNNPDRPTRAILSKKLLAPQYLTNAQMFYDHEYYEDAVSSCSAAIIKQEQNPEAYYLRALAYKELKNYKEACRDLIKAESQGSEDAKRILGLNFQQMAQNYIIDHKYEEGFGYWSKAESRGIIGLPKEATDLYLKMVKGYITAGKYEIASSHLTDLQALGDANFKKEVAALQKDLEPALKRLVVDLSVVSSTKTNSSPAGSQPKKSFRDALVGGSEPKLASSSLTTMQVETKKAEVRGSHIVPKGQSVQVDRGII